MERNVKLYNLIFPVWMLWIFPPAWLAVIPLNLLIDALVLFLTLTALKRPDRRALLRTLLLPMWLFGFLADFVGSLWMFLGHELLLYKNGGWNFYRPFQSPEVLAWTLAAVVLSGVCIYLFDRFLVKRSLTALSPRERHMIALTMAIATAPWTFFLVLG